MRKLKNIKILIIILFTVSLISGHAFAKSDTLRFEVLLHSKMLKDINLNDKFINSLEITPNKLILLSTEDQFYLLGWGSMKPCGKKMAGKNIYEFL